MKLTPQEAEHMESGIYRGTIWVEPPNMRQPESDEFIAELKRVRHSQMEGCPNFYPTSDAFLEAWITGYRDFPDTAGAYEDRSYINPRVKGFELDYINWHPGSRYFSIGGTDALFAEDTRFHRFMIASDINGMNDQYGYMNVGINDFENERALIWRGVLNDALSDKLPYQTVWNMKKPLREDLHFYLWSGKENFPFESPNCLKSGGVDGQWTMIGIEPEEVYNAFVKRG